MGFTPLRQPCSFSKAQSKVNTFFSNLHHILYFFLPFRYKFFDNLLNICTLHFTNFNHFDSISLLQHTFFKFVSSFWL